MDSLHCPACGTADVTNINYELEDGGTLSFYSCHSCEERWWLRDGAPVSLPDALALQRRNKTRR